MKHIAETIYAVPRPSLLIHFLGPLLQAKEDSRVQKGSTIEGTGRKHVQEKVVVSVGHHIA
jgi:hypothetical protein